MPFTFVETSHDPTCVLTTWSVNAPDTLADVIAWLYLQKREHAEAVIQKLDPGRAALPSFVVPNAIEALSVNLEDIATALASVDEGIRKKAESTRDTRIEHRDGLLFQHVSWVAAHLRLPNARATPPHVRQADKGFDGVLLEIGAAGTDLSRIVLCEDKASINPRSLVTASIWPDIRLILKDKKDREILAAVTSILDTLPGVNKEAVIEATEWQRSRQFRVSLTAGWPAPIG